MNNYMEVVKHIAAEFDRAANFVAAGRDNETDPDARHDLRPLLAELQQEPVTKGVAKRYQEAMLDDCPYRARSTLAKVLLFAWLVKKPKAIQLPDRAIGLIRQHGWIV